MQLMKRLKQIWKSIQNQYRKASRFGSFKSFRLRPYIVKANDDLRQEVLAMQLMKRLKQIFDEARLSIFLKPYDIFVTSSSSGMLEFVPDTVSLDALKKQFLKDVQGEWTLAKFFRQYFIHNFEEAQKNFIESLAGYSLFNYLFNVKDRHNGNILLDSQGHLVHIDFGFLFQNSPGGVNFERAPFKITEEYLDLMGGVNSEMFEYFKSLLTKGFFEIRKHLDDLLVLVEIMMKDSKMPCFENPVFLKTEIRERISLKYNTREKGQESDYFELVDYLVYDSVNSWT
eukprot:CAMPEP_0202978556 /NCGR_PEP_ID=MMETSP1396-20130829/84932_1 /ASSEMBLY_ACC=CAM_ASM_000872 /TAXON_ID= /ORGANISM="Pseudokeronopsis sp., Strain Brazil" /LENGTH=284 /DNA_ID=CAMNT_0049717551 /DNA_START=421 /DNA_END=1272 /DNA_ORIENTATION=+